MTEIRPQGEIKPAGDYGNVIPVYVIITAAVVHDYMSDARPRYGQGMIK